MRHYRHYRGPAYWNAVWRIIAGRCRRRRIPLNNNVRRWIDSRVAEQRERWELRLAKVVAGVNTTEVNQENSMAKKGNNPVTKQVKFKMVGTTPGALRYEEVDAKGKTRKTDEDGAIVGSLYLRKQAAEGAEPEFVDVTISYKG